MADKWIENLNKQADLYNQGKIDLNQYNAAVKDARAEMVGYGKQLEASTGQLKKSLLGLGSSMVEGKN
jgi:hypothetical protein